MHISYEHYLYIRNIERHHNALGSFENGTAVHDINKIIKEHAEL